MRSRLLSLCCFGLLATLTAAPADAAADGLPPPSETAPSQGDVPGAEQKPATASPPDTAPSAAPAAVEKPAAPAAAPAPSPAQGPAPASSEVGRGDQFRDVERRVADLKDQVTRSKARLSLLTETLMRSSQGSTRMVLLHKNQMGMLFQMVRVTYQVDGRVVFDRSDETGAALAAKELPVWEGSLKPGDHTVGVEVVYRGNGSKVFAYYDKYTFTARAAQRVATAEGQTTRVHVVCQEKGNALTRELKDRPSFDFRVNPTEAAPAAPAAAGAAAAAGGASAR